MNQSGIIIQARTGSTRLPNKMLLPFYKGLGIFENLLKRLGESSISIPIIIATTNRESDNELVEISKKYGFNYFRGDEDNVLERFIGAAEYFKINNIIRLCADNPLIDIEAIEHQLNTVNNDVDYYCYSTKDKKPTIKTGYGFWTEMVTLNALKKIASRTNEKIYLEHVTNYIYLHVEDFNIQYKEIDSKIEEISGMRLTVDTAADFKLLKDIYDTLISKNIDFNALEITRLVAEYPEWLKIMRAETQKNIK